MVQTAKLNPEVFFATCARLIPKDVQLSIQQHYSSDLAYADLEVLKAIREALPDAKERKPGDVPATRAESQRYISCKRSQKSAERMERSSGELTVTTEGALGNFGRGQRWKFQPFKRSNGLIDVFQAATRNGALGCSMAKRLCK
jgi:hypothetical protein